MKLDANAIRRAMEALASNDEIADDERWPKSRLGYPKIACSDAQAERWIAEGIATEDDLFRVKDIPLTTE